MPQSYTRSYQFGITKTDRSTFLSQTVIFRPIMRNLIQVGLFCCLLLVRLDVCLSQENEDVSISFIQDLIRKIHQQDEKIAAKEANTNLDRKDLVSKILMLEEKLKDSDYKQQKIWTKLLKIQKSKHGPKIKII